MAVQIQIRRDTSANWTSINPILAQGELGFETDTLRFKLGNGSASWTSLGHTLNTLLNGTSVPGAEIGVNGDFYINTATSSIYGPKAAGTWPAAVSLKGADGIGDVTLTGMQTITNKTISAASNTITTATSGNLAATTLNAALAELQSDIDTRALSSTAVTLTGVQTLTNKTIIDTVYAVTGTTPALTATNGAVQTWTLTAASAPVLTSLTTGQSIILVITPGAYAITWPSVVWTKQGGSGTLPTLFSTGKTTVVLWKVGTVVYGSHLGDTV